MLHFTCLKSQILKNSEKCEVCLGHKHPKNEIKTLVIHGTISDVFFKENKTFRSEQIPGSALRESCYSLLIDSHTRDC